MNQNGSGLAQVDARAFRHLIRQMSQAFRESSGGSPLERFDAISKLLYAKLYDEQRARADGTYSPRFARIEGTQASDTCAQVLSLYRDAANTLPETFTGNNLEIADDPIAIARVVGLLQNIELSSLPMDIKGTAYEELVRNTLDKTENQQFFTPRPAVEFMVDLAEPRAGQLVLDPACGSGGFLIDVATYLSARDSVAQLIGLEIDRRMAMIAQMNLAMHGALTARVYHLPNGGSLAFSPALDQIVPPGTVDLILTNPPFGSDFSDLMYLSQYRLGQGRSSRRRGVLFIERCLRWLRPGGKLAIIIDDSVLNARSYTDVRQLILDSSILEAVVSLPEVTFQPYATVKTSILLMRKRQSRQEPQEAVFMADVENVGRKLNGDPLYAVGRSVSGDAILQNDLPSVVSAWRDYRRLGETAIKPLSPKVFVSPAHRFDTAGFDTRDLRIDVQYHHPSREVAENTLRQSAYPIVRLSELVVERSVSAVPANDAPDEIWNYIGLANIVAATGEYEVSSVLGSEVRSAVRLYRPGDILFAKLRPSLRKCILVAENEDEGYVSSECYVLVTLQQALSDPQLQMEAQLKLAGTPWEIDSEYLSYVLRSDIVYGQLVNKVTGSGRPRVGKTSVFGLRVPVPPISIQQQIAEDYRTAFQLYLDFRAESARALGAADRALSEANERAQHLLCPGSQSL